MGFATSKLEPRFFPKHSHIFGSLKISKSSEVYLWRVSAGKPSTSFLCARLSLSMSTCVFTYNCSCFFIRAHFIIWRRDVISYVRKPFLLNHRPDTSMTNAFDFSRNNNVIVSRDLCAGAQSRLLYVINSELRRNIVFPCDRLHSAMPENFCALNELQLMKAHFVLGYCS